MIPLRVHPAYNQEWDGTMINLISFWGVHVNIKLFNLNINLFNLKSPLLSKCFCNTCKTKEKKNINELSIWKIISENVVNFTNVNNFWWVFKKNSLKYWKISPIWYFYSSSINVPLTSFAYKMKIVFVLRVNS